MALRKAEQKERTHESILASAARVVRQRGIAGARVADVMEGAGLTVGGFYAHFGSKEALVDAAIKRMGATMRERLLSHIEDKPADDQAEVMLKRYLSPAHRDDVERGCPFPAVVGEVSTTAREHEAVLAGEIDQLAREIERHLPASAKEHALPARQVALATGALMYGGLSLSRALRSTALADEILKACRAVGVAVLRGRW